MKRWTEDDIPWDRFDPSKVNPEILKVVKAAGLTERNASDYATYLGNVFRNDPEFYQIAQDWAEEEIQHGDVLGRWAEMADPGYDFKAAFKRFVEGYRVPIDVAASVRGSQTGELLARCIVETGTSSFYSALKDATDEPVLQEICRRIAADEFRHYKLFYEYMKRTNVRERVSVMARAWVAIGRVKETDDDELAFAYHCGNEPGQAYDHARCNRAYAARAYGFYQPRHVERAVGMILKAVGLKPQGFLGRHLSRYAWRTMRRRAAALAAA